MDVTLSFTTKDYMELFTPGYEVINVFNELYEVVVKGIALKV